MDAGWRPVEAAAALLEGFGRPWWVAGGWALDLSLGRVTRRHGDVDLAVLRRDQDALRRHLAGWSLRWVEPWHGGLFHPWREGEWLAAPVHEIHGTRDADRAVIELLLNDAEGDEWRYRREPGIGRPLRLVGRRSPRDVPYLCPEVVILYKAQDPRSTDEADFAAARGSLDAEQRSWLRDAIATCHGVHPWLAEL